MNPVVNKVFVGASVAGIIVVLVLVFTKEINNSKAQLETHETDKSTLLSKYISILDTSTPNEALLALYSDVNNNILSGSDCHDIAHELGHRAFLKYGSFEEASQFQNSVCNAGYIHGVIESYFDGKEAAGNDFVDICLGADAQTFSGWECYHGLGHGYMYAFDQSIEKAAGSCEKLPDQHELSACYNGAYMQYFMLAHRGISDQELLQFCQNEPALYNLDCYLYAPLLYLDRHPNDYEGAFEWCQSENDAKLQLMCTQGVIAEITRIYMNDVDTVKNICQTSMLTDKMCMKTIVRNYINNHASLEGMGVLCKEYFPDYLDACKEASEQHLLNKK